MCPMAWRIKVLTLKHEDGADRVVVIAIYEYIHATMVRCIRQKYAMILYVE